VLKNAVLSRNAGLNNTAPQNSVDSEHFNGIRIVISRNGLQRVASWRELGDLDWSDYGLVLGAGGATGLAFHAGILLGLGVDHNISVADAGHLVGTSAGSIAAALVAIGLDSADLAAIVANAPQQFSEAAKRVQASFSPERLPQLPPPWKVLRLQGPNDIIDLARLAHLRNFRAAFLKFLRDGEFDFREQVFFLDAVDWPTTVKLSICATESNRAGRVVMQRDSRVPLIDAVVASCAVPGVMRSIQIDGSSYVDGGLVSPTSADLLAGGGHPKLVVIISPMSGTHSRSVQGRLSSRFASNCVRRELKKFGSDQTVVLIEPVCDLSRLVVDENLRSHVQKEILRSTFTSSSL
jgi:NTE family protein